jgi:hypothetical protein
MNRSLVLVAALGLAACTSTPTPENNATSMPTSTTSPQATVVTEVVTQTVTNPPAKPVIDAFGYGRLKLGMTRQQALDANLIGPDLPGPNPADNCTIHEIIGTDQKAYVSKKFGTSSIWFTSGMTTDGVGIGTAEAGFKAKYPDLPPMPGRSNSYQVGAAGNAAAKFQFAVVDGKVGNALLMLNEQDCHN